MILSLLPLQGYRAGRVIAKQLLSVEPYIPRKVRQQVEYHGGAAGGWGIPVAAISTNSKVVDVGLGEDLAFPASLTERYGCEVHGFDPTPRAIAFAKSSAPTGFILHEVGVAGSTRWAEFYLPSNKAHVSGSLVSASHTKGAVLQVQLIDLHEVFRTVNATRIDLLKMDVEGAEYEIIASQAFQELATSIGILCLEFHHRWDVFGKAKTIAAVQQLKALGFECLWRDLTTNEEFTFVQTRR